MNRLSDVIKIDRALTSASNNGAVTGPYFRLDNDRKACFIVEIGAMAAAATSALQVMQATNAAAGGAKVVTVATATMTANTRVSSALLTSSAVHVAGDTVTINGLVFTAAAADVPGSRTYAIGADEVASTLALANKINAAVIGVPGVLAAANAGILTLTAIEPGDASITITAVSTGGVAVPSTASAVGYVEVDASQLDTVNGFKHVALRLTNSAAMQSGAVLIRGNSRYSPTQYVAASYA
jgi:hypothetical protein